MSYSPGSKQHNQNNTQHGVSEQCSTYVSFESNDFNAGDVNSSYSSYTSYDEILRITPPRSSKYENCQKNKDIVIGTNPQDARGSGVNRNQNLYNSLNCVSRSLFSTQNYGAELPKSFLKPSINYDECGQAKDNLPNREEDLQSRLIMKEREIQLLRSDLASALKVKDNTFNSKQSQLINRTQQDLIAAKELSNARQKEIESLETMVEAYRAKLSKANERIEKLEKAASGYDSRPESENEVLRKENSSLKKVAKQDERTISELKLEVSLMSAKLSHSERIENELLDTRALLEDTQAQNDDLKEALEETKAALVMVSNAQNWSSPEKNPSKWADTSFEENSFEDS